MSELGACGVHPDAPAVLVCDRCGTLACARCRFGSLCEDCAARHPATTFERERSPSAFLEVVRALLIEPAAFFSTLPPGPAGPAVAFSVGMHFVLGIAWSLCGVVTVLARGDSTASAALVGPCVVAGVTATGPLITLVRAIVFAVAGGLLGAREAPVIRAVYYCDVLAPLTALPIGALAAMSSGHFLGYDTLPLLGLAWVLAIAVALARIRLIGLFFHHGAGLGWLRATLAASVPYWPAGAYAILLVALLVLR